MFFPTFFPALPFISIGSSSPPHVFLCSMLPSCSMNRPSPLCPPALLPMFRPPSTPSLLASRDCESHTYMHTSQSSPCKTACLSWLTAKEFQDNNHSHCWRALCAFYLMKSLLQFSLSLLSSLDLSAQLPSPQEVSAGWAVSVCCAASVKPVFSLIQPNNNFSTIYTPTPQSTCLLQLEPCTFSGVNMLTRCCCCFSFWLQSSSNIVF